MKLLELLRRLNLIAALSTDHFFQVLKRTAIVKLMIKGYNDTLTLSVYQCLLNTYPEYRLISIQIEDFEPLHFLSDAQGMTKFKDQSNGCVLCPRVISLHII